jgi:hypothetical protein
MKIMAAGRICLSSLLLFLCCALNSNASYVTTTTVNSFPYQSSGFSYSDGSGNSISVNQTQAVPIIVNQYPNAVWVTNHASRIPANAIIYQYINGYPVFFCRVRDGADIYYGQLVVNEGCYLDDYDGPPTDNYDVLVR